MLTFEQAMEYLNTVQNRNIAPGLAPVRALLFGLGDPQEAFSCIHIAGTNGKGSTAAMLEAVLRQAGIRTGLFTSPYLYDISERIQIDGKPIDRHSFATLTEAVRQAEEAAGIQAGYFAFLTALCFLYFRQQRVRLAVVEVGLGGRLDPTNVLQAPEAVIITHIGLDHTAILGDTVEAIAAEKGGIIKYGCPVVLQAQEDAPMQVIARMAAGRHAPLHVTDALASSVINGRLCVEYNDQTVPLGVSGAYQAKNAAAVIKTVEVLQKQGWRISEQALYSGLQNAAWAGRFEQIKTVGTNPVIFDGAHNPQGMEALTCSLQAYYPKRPVLFILAMMRDKDAARCIRPLLPQAKAMIAVGMEEKRALLSGELYQIMQTEGVASYQAADMNAAIDRALALAAPEDVICICGSLHLRAYIR